MENTEEYQQAQKYIKSLSNENAEEFTDRMYDLEMYGESLEDGISYLKRFENRTGKEMPVYFKKKILDGFLGGVWIATDCEDGQSDSLLLKMIKDVARNPEGINKIWNSEDFMKRYKKLAWKAHSHASNRWYYSPEKQHSFVR